MKYSDYSKGVAYEVLQEFITQVIAFLYLKKDIIKNTDAEIDELINLKKNLHPLNSDIKYITETLTNKAKSWGMF